MAALSKEPQSVSELVSKVYSDVDKKMWEMAGCSLASGLIKLQQEGRVEEKDGGYRVASSAHWQKLFPILGWTQCVVVNRPGFPGDCFS